MGCFQTDRSVNHLPPLSSNIQPALVMLFCFYCLTDLRPEILPFASFLLLFFFASHSISTLWPSLYCQIRLVSRGPESDHTPTYRLVSHGLEYGALNLGLGSESWDIGRLFRCYFNLNQNWTCVNRIVFQAWKI
ncbi:hypothetical protein BDV18DRAFT_139501 [Aspergillus unguis]